MPRFDRRGAMRGQESVGRGGRQFALGLHCTPATARAWSETPRRRPCGIACGTTTMEEEIVRLEPTPFARGAGSVTRALIAVLTVSGFALTAGGARAADAVKDYPLRPIRLVTPFAPGGSTDSIARYLAPKLSERLGQNVIVENRPGAGGMIGTHLVAKSTPDGHTLLLPSGAFTAQAASVSKLPYDAVRDFAWVSMMLTYPFVLVVKADSPLKGVADLVAAARAHPGKFNYGTVGIGSVFHLAAELFNSLAKVETVHVPFKGGSEPVVAMVGGQIDFMFTTMTGITPHIKAGRARALGICSLDRHPQMPDVPPVAQVLPGFEVTSFAGVAAPRGTPRPVIDRLNAVLREVLEEPATRKHLAGLGGEPRPTSPEEMQRHVEAEIAKWRRIVKERRIEVQ